MHIVERGRLQRDDGREHHGCGEPPTVNVTATSPQDTSKSGSVIVTLSLPLEATGPFTDCGCRESDTRDQPLHLGAKVLTLVRCGDHPMQRRRFPASWPLRFTATETAAIPVRRHRVRFDQRRSEPARCLWRAPQLRQSINGGRDQQKPRRFDDNSVTTAQAHLYSNANLSAIVAQPAVTVAPPASGGAASAITTAFPAQSITPLVVPN